MIVIGGRFVAPLRGMISGIDQAEKGEYKVAIGKSGKRWLYNDDIKGCASHIYVEGEPGSQGFGGSVISFKLLNGDVLNLRGPWHTNSHSMFADTGIDLRDRSITFGVIGTDREFVSNSMSMAISNVLYFDTEPTEGSFNRIKDLANKMAIERGQELAFYSESEGGSQCGFTHALKKETKYGD